MSPPPPDDPIAPVPRERWRFSLASILFVMTLVSIVLALVRAIPIPEAMRQALLVLAGLWSVVALIALLPKWRRFAALRRQVRAREAQLRAWAEEQRRALQSPKDE